MRWTSREFCTGTLSIMLDTLRGIRAGFARNVARRRRGAVRGGPSSLSRAKRESTKRKLEIAVATQYADGKPSRT